MYLVDVYYGVRIICGHTNVRILQDRCVESDCESLKTFVSGPLVVVQQAT